jgi:hypothetical protein
LMRVFSTDNFRPCVGPRYICDGRSPGCREDAFIFDGQVQLQNWPEGRFGLPIEPSPEYVIILVRDGVQFCGETCPD